MDNKQQGDPVIIDVTPEENKGKKHDHGRGTWSKLKTKLFWLAVAGWGVAVVELVAIIALETTVQQLCRNPIPALTQVKSTKRGDDLTHTSVRDHAPFLGLIGKPYRSVDQPRWWGFSKEKAPFVCYTGEESWSREAR